MECKSHLKKPEMTYAPSRVLLFYGSLQVHFPAINMSNGNVLTINKNVENFS